MELECPLYEKCYTCGSTGSFGYVNRHHCKPDDQVVSLDRDNCYDSDTTHLLFTYLTHYAYVPKPHDSDS